MGDPLLFKGGEGEQWIERSRDVKPEKWGGESNNMISGEKESRSMHYALWEAKVEAESF